MQSLNSLLSGILTKSLRRLVAAPPRLKSRRSSKSNPSSDRHGGGSAAVAFAVGSVGGITCGVFLAEHDLLPERLSFSKTTPSSSLILDDSSAARVLGGEAPSQSYRRVSESFVSEFDTSTRNPRWVVEQLHAKDKISHRNNSSSEASTTSSAAVAVSREGHTFREDDSLLVHHRSRPAHYKGSGLDRGHLAPAADMISDEGMSDSFRLSNVSPQVGKGFNR
jgi:DNA/RNA endonuclease G (NUC1)